MTLAGCNYNCKVHCIEAHRRNRINLTFRAQKSVFWSYETSSFSCQAKAQASCLPAKSNEDDDDDDDLILHIKSL